MFTQMDQLAWVNVGRVCYTPCLSSKGEKLSSRALGVEGPMNLIEYTPFGIYLSDPSGQWMLAT